MLPVRSDTCNNRDTSLASLENLITQRGVFDYLLLETSGLADPGNLAPLFWTDDGLGSNVYLDGIVTLVDARNIARSLDEPVAEELESHTSSGQGSSNGRNLSTAHLQISHADVILLNKVDTLSSPQDVEAVKERIAGINGLARVHVTEYSKVPELEKYLLDLRAYDGVEGLEKISEGKEMVKGHGHLDPVSRLPLLILAKRCF